MHGFPCFEHWDFMAIAWSGCQRGPAVRSSCARGAVQVDVGLIEVAVRSSLPQCRESRGGVRHRCHGFGGAQWNLRARERCVNERHSVGCCALCQRVVSTATVCNCRSRIHESCGSDRVVAAEIVLSLRLPMVVLPDWFVVDTSVVK
jgi:hypothetical protein